MLKLIKLAHTLVWAFFVACIVGIFLATARDRFGLASILIGVVWVEVVVLVVNRMRCPLTDIAANYTADRRENFDIDLPRWLAANNQRLFGALFVLGMVYTLLRWVSSSSE